MLRVSTRSGERHAASGPAVVGRTGEFVYGALRRLERRRRGIEAMHFESPAVGNNERKIHRRIVAATSHELLGLVGDQAMLRAARQRRARNSDLEVLQGDRRRAFGLAFQALEPPTYLVIFRL